MTPTTANVLSVYALATADNLRKGLSWYLDAHNLAGILSPGDIAKGAGVIAALSPRQTWTGNKTVAERAFAQGNANGLGMGANTRKADRILAGENPLDVLGGDKVRAFYATILDPFGFSYPVIDRHAFDIAVGMATDDKARSILSRKGVYAAFAEVYIDAAKVAGISSSQMQAVTWEAWREMKGEM